MSPIVAILFSLKLMAPGASAEMPPFGRVGANLSPVVISNPQRWMAIAGDSGATGAASDPRLTANVFTFLGRLGVIGVREGLALDPGAEAERITRILFTPQEFEAAVNAGKVPQLERSLFGSVAIDQPQNTFGVMVGRELGVAPSDIVMVAEDGKRVSSIPTQIERIFATGQQTLPPLVLMSYTANDFCDLNVFNESVEERTARFEKSLTEAWAKAEPFLRAHPRGTEFVVLAPLDVANVLTNPGILAQEIPIGMYGTETCRDLRSGEFERAPVANVIAQALVGMCPAVLGTKLYDFDKLDRLRDVQDAFNRVWKKTIADLNRRFRRQHLRWIYVENVRHLEFSTGDVAHECFHPSASGHTKIFRAVMNALGPEA